MAVSVNVTFVAVVRLSSPAKEVQACRSSAEELPNNSDQSPSVIEKAPVPVVLLLVPTMYDH